MVRARRLDLLVEAVSILERSGSSVRLIVVGDGPMRRELELLAHELEIDAHFERAVYDEKRLAEYFRQADVTVVPAYAGLTVIHSLAHATPVIVGDDPNLSGPEWEAVQPGSNGDHFRSGDPEDLARVIRDWLRDDHPDLVDACFGPLLDRYNATAQADVIGNVLTRLLSNADPNG